MRPVYFYNYHKIINKNQQWVKGNQVYKGLPCYIKSGRVYSQWQFSWVERIKILFGIPLTLTVISSNVPPIVMEVSNLGKRLKSNKNN